ncbi:hypothetical protein BDA99DRAFT_498442 [Phascolomyces articulosus]|uniref:Uncharacterized protein n=1 Tax=Phascolomyces articulosus TaxID=60185 RepID=A0AAD5K8V0_9FUNG|nr:hypothetical protein BDA99DRAFT_498442 [Phascolomyces articulosus]
MIIFDLRIFCTVIWMNDYYYLKMIYIISCGSHWAALFFFGCLDKRIEERGEKVFLQSHRYAYTSLFYFIGSFHKSTIVLIIIDGLQELTLRRAHIYWPNVTNVIYTAPDASISCYNELTILHIHYCINLAGL